MSNASSNKIGKDVDRANDSRAEKLGGSQISMGVVNQEISGAVNKMRYFGNRKFSLHHQTGPPTTTMFFTSILITTMRKRRIEHIKYPEKEEKALI